MIFMLLNFSVLVYISFHYYHSLILNFITCYHGKVLFRQWTEFFDSDVNAGVRHLEGTALSYTVRS
jgi:hypothetical protein